MNDKVRIEARQSKLNVLWLVVLRYYIITVLVFQKNRLKLIISFVILPHVSILIAARNEEENIISCLEAISQLDYPTEKFSVWIGDDDSSDTTAALVENFIADKSNFSFKANYYSIRKCKR